MSRECRDDAAMNGLLELGRAHNRMLQLRERGPCVSTAGCHPVQAVTLIAYWPLPPVPEVLAPGSSTGATVRHEPPY